MFFFFFKWSLETWSFPPFILFGKHVYIYFWLCWVFVAAWAFLSVQRVGATLQLWCTGFILWYHLLQRSTGSSVWASVVAGQGSRSVAHRFQSTGSTAAVHGLSCSVACGIFPDRGSNLCLLQWLVDSSRLSEPSRKLRMFLTKWPSYTFHSGMCFST